MILKVQNPDIPGTWSYLDNIIEATAELVSCSYAVSQPFERYYLSSETLRKEREDQEKVGIAENEPIGGDVRLVHVKSATYGVPITVVAEVGQSYLMNDDGKTIERL